jgi:hypothetical protein
MMVEADLEFFAASDARETAVVWWHWVDTQESNRR